MQPLSVNTPPGSGGRGCTRSKGALQVPENLRGARPTRFWNRRLLFQRVPTNDFLPLSEGQTIVHCSLCTDERTPLFPFSLLPVTSTPSPSIRSPGCSDLPVEHRRTDPDEGRGGRGVSLSRLEQKDPDTSSDVRRASSLQPGRKETQETLHSRTRGLCRGRYNDGLTEVLHEEEPVRIPRGCDTRDVGIGVDPTRWWVSHHPSPPGSRVEGSGSDDEYRREFHLPLPPRNAPQDRYSSSLLRPLTPLARLCPTSCVSTAGLSLQTVSGSVHSQFSRT